MQWSESLLDDVPALIRLVEQRLDEHIGGVPYFQKDLIFSPSASAVLFLLGWRCVGTRGDPGAPCLILNKRSTKVKQPGDLCCPGGSVVPRLDVYLARLLRIGGSPLARWTRWRSWRRRPGDAFTLALLLATGLRETFEEMRLNPFGTRFLGLLPPERLVMFRRQIYPLVCWVSGQKRFFPNWEVEKVLFVPLRRLLDPANYACYRLEIVSAENVGSEGRIREFPCFLHEHDGTAERLWGATYRITMAFLERVFGFVPPPIEQRPSVTGRLESHYLTGKV